MFSIMLKLHHLFQESFSCSVVVLTTLHFNHQLTTTFPVFQAQLLVINKVKESVLKQSNTSTNAITGKAHCDWHEIEVSAQGTLSNRFNFLNTIHLKIQLSWDPAQWSIHLVYIQCSGHSMWSVEDLQWHDEQRCILCCAGLEFHHFRDAFGVVNFLRAQRPNARAARPVDK